MRTGQFVLLTIAFTLAGCDRITGVANQKILDAEAVGYACRVSQKTPEDCMKENETKSPSSVLDGWKAADKDIQGQLIDPSMGKAPDAAIAHSAPAAAETEGKTKSEKPSEKTAGAKSDKPVAATAKSAAPATPKGAAH